ncbi:MAG: AAA domain-containing protein [Myxococcales bacterium]|jgi:superfamily I DNA and/or RNA helicase
MADPAGERLKALGDQWRLEREAARESFRQTRELLDLPQRVARGLALSRLVVEDTDAAAGDRVLLWVKPERPVAFEDLRVGMGDPVSLWTGDPGGELREAGVISRVGRGALGVTVRSDYGEFLDEGYFNLDREAPEVTFDRGEQALARFRAPERGSPLLRVREVLLGEAAPRQRMRFEAPEPLDGSLDESQRQAVAHALAAEDVALIHGPPGTGKTRALVEVVRQAVARGDRVLVSAASNAAVDNLAERLALHGVPIVRVGHPARVAPGVEARTLDALLDRSEARTRAKRLIAEANELRRRVSKRRARGSMDRRQARQLLAEARGLMRDARGALDAERALQLARVQVVCATAAGADAQQLRDEAFDLVVLDEATQAVDPIALAALARAPVAVLAGDPQQLPPTVVSQEAARAGLSRTLFERLAEREGERVVRMLKVQYRMHAALMRFPSESMYDGALTAADAVAEWRLADLQGVADDPLRPGPFHFIDTAGKGWAEVRDVEDPSTHNPEQAERTAREARRVLSRGVEPGDVAIITPYLAQARLLRALLADAVAGGLEVGTVDGFQGREKDVIIVDLVRSNEDGDVGFLADIRRTNVAITRARRLLLVVGDGTTLARHDFYARLMQHAEATGAYLSAWNDEADAIG